MSAISLPFAGTGSLLLFLAKATLLLVAALIGTATLRRSTAGARHLVWLAALVGVLALPLLSRMLSRIPSLKLDILPSALAPNFAAVAPVFASDPPRTNAPAIVELSSPSPPSSVAPITSWCRSPSSAAGFRAASLVA